MRPRSLLALAMMIALAVVVGSPPGPAHAATTVVSGSNNAGITIPGNGTATPYPSTININAPAYTQITDVNVTLTGLSHTFAADLDVLLVAPDGTTNAVLLADAAAGNDFVNSNVTFDDQAASGVPSVTPIPSGTYRPTAPGTANDPAPAPAPGVPSLSTFDFLDADGTWSLYVFDDLAGDSGSITGWSLDITVSNQVLTPGGATGGSNAAPITINDNSTATPYPSTINVAAPADSAITDVDVTLTGVSHSFAADLDVLLVAPDGTTNAVLLADAAAGNDFVNTDVTFDDQAASGVPSVTPIPSGSYRPTAPGTANDPPPAPSPGGASLGTFNLMDPNGVWSLYVYDDLAGDTGVIAGGWSLSITYAPTVITNVTPPVITGALTTYSELSTTPGTWSPSSVSLAYQWYVAGDPVPGATQSTYTLRPEDVGKNVNVAVTASQPGYTSVTAYATAVGPVTACTFTKVSDPSISGNAKVGKTLEASPGAWSPDFGTTTYQWYADGQPIAGATGQTYTPTAADLGKHITVKVTVARAGCTTSSAESSATSAVVKGTFDIVTHAAITGDPVVGRPLTVAGGTWSPTPSTTSYQWTRGGAPIPGATGSSYTPTPDDVGEFLAVTVTVTAPGYEDGHDTAAAEGQVQREAITNTTPPSVSGTPRAGQTLTASDGTWSVTPDDVAFQWFANGQAIDGATGDSLVLDDPALVGQQITVEATASKAGYNSESATSDAVGPVTKAPVTMTKTISTKHPLIGVTQVKIDVTVSAPDGLPVTGTVRVLVNGALLDSGSVDGDGTVRLVLPAFQNPGKHKVKIKYGGSQLLAKKSATAFIYPHD
ncbi:MAG TPA: hypothetical protein VNS55_06630 [Nocardioides sp.]|nr:hypothetical protein [Nocardioides sp.]